MLDRSVTTFKRFFKSANVPYIIEGLAAILYTFHGWVHGLCACPWHLYVKGAKRKHFHTFCTPSLVSFKYLQQFLTFFTVISFNLYPANFYGLPLIGQFKLRLNSEVGRIAGASKHLRLESHMEHNFKATFARYWSNIWSVENSSVRSHVTTLTVPPNI